MDVDANQRIRATVDRLYRSESRRVFASLVRLLGDFDLTEEAVHDAFKAALEQWPASGVPAKPRACLVSTGRFKAIDKIRRNARPRSMTSPKRSTRPLMSHRTLMRISKTIACV